MLHEFFSNTGIQFFGDPSVKLDMNDFHNEDESDDSPLEGNANIDFARVLFLNKWVPFSVDGKRNLFRIFFGASANMLHYVMAIDTIIRVDVEHSLNDDDIGNEINVLPNLIDQQSNNDFDILLPETEKWISDIYEKQKNKLYSDYIGQDPNAAFILLINSFIKAGFVGIGENNFIPKVKILTDKATATSELDSTLILDFGNSRSIGLIVEKDLQTGASNIKNAAPLKIIDYSEFERTGVGQLEEYSKGNNKEFEHLISSKIRFRKNIFQNYIKTETFNLPSICAIGNEAENLPESRRTEGSSGLHGPKRYLWDKSIRKEFWRFHEDDSDELEGEILRYVSLEDSDDVLSDHFDHFLPDSPLGAVYPRRTMMIFSLVEIFYQAFTQVNSSYYRKRVGNARIKRKLNKIIMSFPTGMAFWERERLNLQAKKALAILKNMNAIPYEIDIELGCDEASCSQIAFLYGETKRFKTDLNKFFSLVSGTQNIDSVRLASLDIGGGTSDLMIADYKQDDSSNPANTDITQTILYSDGINLAGDEILKHLISNVLIPKIRESIRAWKGTEADKFEDYFGQGAQDADTQLRVEAMNGLLIPIAEFYMHIMENQNKINVENLNKIENLDDLNEHLISSNLKPLKNINELSYLVKNDIIDSEFYHNVIIKDLVPSVEDLEKEVQFALTNTMFLGRYSAVINHYKPDFLILAGRTTSLPIISGNLKRWLTISPERIISLKEHFIGFWYPFSDNGVITDPKTAVVIGNSVAAMSSDGSIHDIRIITQGPESDFTLNFIGTAKDNDILNEKNVSYKDTDPKNPKSIGLLDRCNIIVRNINDAKMKCNLIYTLSLKDDIKVIKSKPLEIKIDFSDPRKNLNIESITGKVTEGKDISRDATLNDVILNEKTLFEDDYYLDNGIFDLASFI